MKNDQQEYEGRVTFKKPAPGDEYQVHLVLSVDKLRTEYPGKIELGNQNLKADLEKPDGVLWFKVRFPQQKPLPVIVGLKFNGVTVCTGKLRDRQILVKDHKF